MNIQMDRLMDGWIDRYRHMLCEETVGEMIGMTDGYMDRQIDRLSDRYLDGWMDGLMDGWIEIDGQMDMFLYV